MRSILEIFFRLYSKNTAKEKGRIMIGAEWYLSSTQKVETLQQTESLELAIEEVLEKYQGSSVLSLATTWAWIAYKDKRIMLFEED